MASLTRWVLAHRKLVVFSWLVVTVVGIVVSGPASKAMDQKFSVPGKEGWDTNVKIAEQYMGTGGNAAPIIPVVTLPEGTDASSPQVRSQLKEIETKLADALPGARIAGFGSTGSDAFLSDDGRTAFAFAYPTPDPDQPFGDNPDAAKAASAALNGFTIDGAPVHVTGYDALNNQAGGDEGPGVLLEALIGGFGALLVLGFVFASFLAVVPLMMAVPAIMTSFLVVYGITFLTDVSPIVQFLIALIGLGVAIDYSLIVVVRWREEIAHGHEGDEAIVRAMETAGRAVVFSGTTVAVGLIALLALPLPFLRSVGYGGMVIPLISVLVALTLLPVVLHSLGRKLDWPHRRSDDKASKAWTGWAERIVHHRAIAALVACVVLGGLIIAASNIHFGTSNVDTLAQSGDAKDGLVALEDSGIGSGSLVPYEILVGGDADAQKVATNISALGGIGGSVAPDVPGWSNSDAGTSLAIAYSTADASTPEARALLDEVRGTAHAAGSEVTVGGIESQNKDFIDAVYGNFPLMIALIAVITFILLARAFRSLLLPAKAVILNVISVAAAWGVLTLIWQYGYGSELLWNIDATGTITSWIPLMVFAFLFGLSMDYEVFILARMREEYDATGNTDEAVVRGIGRTGRLVTSAALILFLAFMSMASSPGTDIKVLATGLAAGILIDATIIRALLVPAMVSLFGRWNWVLPELPARILRVEPSLPPAVEPERA